MEACDTELRPGCDPQGQLDEVKALTNDVIAEGKKVEDLKKVNICFTLLISFQPVKLHVIFIYRHRNFTSMYKGVSINYGRRY